MPISNNLKEHLRHLSQERAHAVDSGLIAIMNQASDVAAPVPRTVRPLQNSTQINIPAANDKEQIDDDIIDITPVVAGQNTSTQNRPLQIPSTKRQSTLDDRLVKKTKPNDLGKDDVKLLQDYIRICEAKINLLNEKNSITESTSISVDDKQRFFNLKFKPRFDKINNNQVKLRSKLLFLNNDSIDDTDLINSLSENPSPAKQDSLNQLDGIDFTSDFSDTNIDDAPPSPNQLKMNLEEARQIVLNTKSNHPPPPAPLPHSDNDDEDDFGNNTFEGLYTPPNEADDNYDLSDFIDDNDDASVDDSYRDTQVRLESENNNIIVDDDEINNLKLSQDVADKLGVNYNVANSEIDLVSDVDDNSTMNDKKPNLEEKEFEDTVEEIDDLDCTTQFNQERELNNHDIIEISSDDDDDDDDIGNRNDDEIDEIVSSSIPTFPAKTQKPIPISNDSDFGDTDDEELLELMNNNSSKSTLPSSTQLPQDIPPAT
ncbi:hypothetical protein QCA50_012960 [Cerrena zonata]|uniref:Uncharacterized protein n=1 Tax=Cerrena zonata TaxID=2478898 RepID=A0AAW0FX57_9APHY